MSIIALTSAAGAPGVTATTLGLACTSPGPALAVEADPVGGSAMLAGFYGGFQHSTGSLVDLVLAHRSGRLAEQLSTCLMPITGTTASILPGPRSHAQARSVLELWQPLCLLWRAMDDTDVFVDAGRLGMEAYPDPVLTFADLVVLVIRSDLVSLAAAKQWCDQAKAYQQEHPSSPEWVGLIIEPNRPYGPREVAAGLGITVVSTIRRVLHGSALQPDNLTARRHTPLMTDLTRCGQEIRDRIEASRRPLNPIDPEAARRRPDTYQSPQSSPGLHAPGDENGPLA